MSSSSAIRAGQAFVEIFADDSKLVRGLSQSERAIKAWSAKVSAAGMSLIRIGTSMLAPLLAATKIYSSMGAELARASAKTGVSVEALSALKFAAEESGVSFEALEKGIAKMSKTMVSAAGGNQQALNTFEQLGLSLSDLSKMAPDKQIGAVADALAKIKQPNLRMSLAQQIFGKAGAELLPLLSQGSAGINEFTEEAKSLGLVMSGQDAQAALKFTREMHSLWDVVKMAAFTVGAAFAPVLSDLAKKIVAGTQTVRKFIDQHRALVQIVGKAAIAFVVAGAGLLILGKAGNFVASAFSVLKFGVSMVYAALSGVMAVIAGLASPIGIALGAVVALGAAFLYLTDAAEAVRGYLSEMWAGLKSDFLLVYKGVAAALSAGDWSLAASILWTGLKMAWVRGTAALKESWAEFKAFFETKGHDAIYGVLAAWEIGTNAVASAWASTTYWMSAVWDAFVNNIVDAWNGAHRLVSKGINEVKGLWDKAFGKGGFNVAAENAKVDKTFDDKKDARSKAEGAAEAKRQADLKAKQSQLQKEHDATMAAIATANAHDDAAVAAEKTKKLADLQKEMDKLHAELAASLANQTATAEGQSAELNKPRLPKFDPDDVQDGLTSAMKHTAGTFNASAIFGLGGNNAAERTANNTEKLVTQQLKTNAILATLKGNGGVVFD